MGDSNNYFKPQYLGGIGTLEDGGIRANCPLRLAVRESMNVWPDAGRPDLAVSMDTGFVRRRLQRNCDSGFSSNGRFKGGFIGRGIRTFLSSPAVDSKEGFEDALDNLPEELKEDVFRLDKDLEENLPELDDAGYIDKLFQITCDIPTDLARVLLTSSFFFELDEEPILKDGHYCCCGSNLCSKTFPEGILCLVEKEVPSARFVMHNGANLGLVQEHDGCHTCGYYRKRVCFRVSSLHERGSD